MNDLLSPDNYKRFLDSLPYGVLISKIDGSFLYVNKAMTKMLKMNEEELMKRKTTDFYVNVEERENIYQKLLNKERVVNYKIMLRRGDGEVFPALVSVVDYMDENKNFVGFMVLVNDISELYERNKYTRLLAEIVRKTPHFVLVLDENFRIKIMNDSLKKFMNKDDVEFHELPFFKDIKRLKDNIENLSQENEFYGDTEGFRFKNNEYVFTYIVFPVVFDSEKFYVFIFKDITYQIKLEKELADKSRIEALERVVSNFVYRVNERLSEIISLTMLAKSESESDYLDEILDKIDDISELIDKASMFTRHRGMSKNVFNPKQAILELIQEYKEIFPESVNISVTGCDDCKVYVNEEIFKNTIFSLIINSLEAFEEIDRDDKKIHISLEKVKRNGKSFVKIEVYDNACGIKNEDLPKIFEPFFSTKHENDGHGLSLSVAYGFVKDNEGDIFVESEFGKYTKFVIFLPVQ